MKKYSKIVAVIATTLLLVTVIGASFAYFMSGSVNTTNKTDVRGLTGSAIPISLLTVGDNISLSASSQSMIEASISNVAVATDDGTLEVKLTAGTSEVPIECEYDIYYVWESDSDTYTRSDNNKLEFTYHITENGYLYKRETNYINTSNVPQKIGTEKIISFGSEITNTYIITSSFYNIDADQSDNANKSFNLKYYIDTNESRCIKHVPYTGTAYVNNESLGRLGTKIYPEYGTKWVINFGDFETFYYDTEAECNSALTTIEDGEDGICVQKTGVFSGINDYEVNLSSFLNKDFPIYCSISSTACTYDERQYFNINDCNTGTRVCKEFYLTRPYYIKTTIVNDVITDSVTCINYNNQELCLQGNYWVDGDNDGNLTKAKLLNDVSTINGLTLSSCSATEDEVYCHYSTNDSSVSYSFYIDRLRTAAGYGGYGSEGKCHIEQGGYFSCRYEDCSMRV